MEVKFEHAVTVLLSIQVILLLMTHSILSDYLTEVDDDEDYYKDSCSCYCDYPYYWYGYDVAVAEPVRDGDANEDNSTASNDTA
jgi:hypothetical protein